ncbi:MAG: HU family DNA-binding protein [Opitutia bacterium]|jgi:nucleoid DNA-binding protein
MPQKPANLTKREIVLRIFEETNHPQKAIRDAVQRTLEIIQQALLEGRDVELRNFGVFEVQVRESRIGRNPNRPETDVVIPRRAVVKFKAGKEFKKALRENDLARYQHLGGDGASGTSAPSPDSGTPPTA